MRRVVVLGGTGFFGRSAMEILRDAGIPALAAARRSVELALDAEDPASVRRALRPGDVVLDAAGPFQARTPALAEAAIELGCDVVDIADASAYVRSLLALRERAAEAGVRLLPACSTCSAVSSAMVAWSGLPHPVRLTSFLIPTTRYTAVAATAASLLAGVGRPIPVLRDGVVRQVRGFAESRRWPAGTPLGARRGWIFDTPDGDLLPLSHPTLATAEAFVDPNVAGLAGALALAARVPPLRASMTRTMPAALPLVRLLGREHGGFGCEVEDASGAVIRLVLTAPRDAYRLAVIPAVLAVRSILEGRMCGPGVIPPHAQVDAAELLDALRARGFELSQSS
jgi:uncharacterized protein YbjT (DUF2867 family)